MNRSMQANFFWEKFSPITFLSGAAILIMASDRLAHAIVVTLAMMWVHCLTVLVAHAGAKLFPGQLRTVLIAFLASFNACLFLFLLWLISPLCALQTFFVISLIPMLCMVSVVVKKLDTYTLGHAVSAACTESLFLGLLVVIFAIIREPFGFLSLSLPGGPQGIVLLFSIHTESFLPIRLVASASGALLLLGYCLGLYRFLKAGYELQEDKQ